MNHPDLFDILAMAFSAAIVALALRYLPAALQPVADAVTVYAGVFQ